MTDREIIGFHLVTEPYGCFSNWHASDFTYAGVRYNCVEQYMMAQKVRMGQRDDLAEQIMAGKDPARIKALAGKDSFREYGRISSIWEKYRRQIVKRGVRAKFSQDPESLRVLLDTGYALLAECARQDTVWGIGINLNNPVWKDEKNWRGSNILGQILMEVRDELRWETEAKGSARYVDYRMADSIPEWRMPVGHLRRFPQYGSAVHLYAAQLEAGPALDAFYAGTLEEMERRIRSGRNQLPSAGFFEMKQDIYETARKTGYSVTAGDIFRVEPSHWELEGDPYFWQILETAFAFDDISMTEEEMTGKINLLFRENTGRLPERNASGCIEDNNGMPHGEVSYNWLINEVIPLLCGRLKVLQQSGSVRKCLGFSGE